MDSTEFNNYQRAENALDPNDQCPEVQMAHQSDPEIIRRLSALLHNDEIDKLATILSNIKMDLDRETL
jgi:hypothetical protein